VIEVGQRFPAGIKIIGDLCTLGCPIIALATPEDGSSVVRALECGADDYLTAIPSTLDLLESRFAALPRRTHNASPPGGSVFSVRDLTVDLDRCEAALNGHIATLTPTQFALLAALVQNAGRVMSAQQLMKETRDQTLSDIEARQIVKVHMRRLRARLARLAPGSNYIVNVRGFGYMLERRERPRSDEVPSDPRTAA
jgi:two-component system KDP operon response regulator KdpE